MTRLLIQEDDYNYLLQKVEKQQKEIEELQTKNHELVDLNDVSPFIIEELKKEAEQLYEELHEWRNGMNETSESYNNRRYLSSKAYRYEQALKDLKKKALENERDMWIVYPNEIIEIIDEVLKGE